MQASFPLIHFFISSAWQLVVDAKKNHRLEIIERIKKLVPGVLLRLQIPPSWQYQSDICSYVWLRDLFNRKMNFMKCGKDFRPSFVLYQSVQSAFSFLVQTALEYSQCSTSANQRKSFAEIPSTLLVDWSGDHVLCLSFQKMKYQRVTLVRKSRRRACRPAFLRSYSPRTCALTILRRLFSPN